MFLELELEQISGGKLIDQVNCLEALKPEGNSIIVYSTGGKTWRFKDNYDSVRFEIIKKRNWNRSKRASKGAPKAGSSAKLS